MAGIDYKQIGELNRGNYPRFSEREYAERYRRIRAEMAKRDLDCLIIYGNSTVASHGSANVRWVANYWDAIQSYVVFPLKGEPTLLCTIAPQLPLAVSMSVLEDVRHGGHPAHMPASVVHRVKELGLEKGNIGICGGDIRVCAYIPHNHYVAFQQSFPQARFHEATDLLHELRSVPSAEELVWYQKGAELTDFAMQSLAEAIRPGARDYELYAAIHRHFEKGGFPMFALIGSTPMSNPSMAYPWFYPSERKLQKGDVVLTEISAGYWEYAGQLCRTVALGEPTQQYRDLHRVALEVYRGVQAILKPGNGPKDVVKVSARIAEAGYSIQAPVIHGWGTYVRLPFIGLPNDKTFVLEEEREFQENELLMIEPNPCAHLGCGVFIGDFQRVTPAGGVPYQKFPIDFLVID